MKKEVKFYQARTFRSAFSIIWAALVFVLLSHDVARGSVSLFSEEYQQGEQVVIIQELQETEENGFDEFIGEPIEEDLEEEDLEEELPIDDPVVGLPLDEELPTVKRSVSVRRVMSDIVRDGDLFQIEATLVGFDGIAHELQWQYNNGSGWQDVPDSDGTTALELIANRYNVNYHWRILVSIIQR